MKLLNTIISDIRNGENVDVYLTMLVCLAVITLDLLGVVQSQIVTAAILLTLTLLAFGTLATRKALEGLNRSVEKLEGERSAEAFFKDRSAYAPLIDTVAGARHVCFLGPTLVNAVPQYAGDLLYEILSKQGTVLDVLLLDPDSQAANAAAHCMNEPLESIQRDIARSLYYLERMLQDAVRAGSIEVRLMQASPNYSMVLIDPDESDGRMFVEFIGYHSRIGGRPHVELTRRHDGKWYEYYLQQYRELWEDSRVRLTSREQN